MPAAATAVIPIRTFRGMSRLAGVLSEHQRIALSRALAGRLLDAVEANGLPMIVVTTDSDVSIWASARATVVADPGRGLDGAAATGVSLCAGPWLVVHADLPLVDAGAIRVLTDAAADTGVTLVPSPDGGTTAIAASGPFPFAFGPGSFHRHLASAPEARVVTDCRLAIDVDTPAQWQALGSHVDIP